MSVTMMMVTMIYDGVSGVAVTRVTRGERCYYDVSSYFSTPLSCIVRPSSVLPYLYSL